MRARPLTLIAALAGLACITVNVYFPEAAIRELSEQIEDEVRREAGVEVGMSSSEDASSWGEVVRLALHRIYVSTIGTEAVYAQEAVSSPEISNPAIRKIIESRSKRLVKLNELKAQGIIGENNQALVEVRSLDSLALRDRAAAQRLVREENEDRERLFKEIAAAKNVDLGQLERIRQTYAETLREDARPGEWIQRPDDEWVQK